MGSGDLGAFKASYVDIKAQPNTWAVPNGYFRVWVNANDNNELYARDQLGNNTKITNGGALATGNAQYLWDWFENGSGGIIPEFSAVRLIQGTANDGKLALCDSDVITEDNFLGLVVDGSIAAGGTGKVIYAGKVINAVQGLGLDSMTCMYMSNVPGQITTVRPSFQTDTIFEIGFTKGDDLYLRPRLRSEFG